MEKLKGEEKSFWERALLAALSGQPFDDTCRRMCVNGAVLAADLALEAWRERCDPDPNFGQVEAYAAYREALADWKAKTALTAEEQALADALPDAPACQDCGHPKNCHEESCLVLIDDEGNYCDCEQRGSHDGSAEHTASLIIASEGRFYECMDDSLPICPEPGKWASMDSLQRRQYANRNNRADA